MSNSHESNNPKSFHKPEYEWLGRSLDNYKSMHARTAESRGVGEQLRSAKTLTQARKIVFGYKKKNTR